MLNHFVIESRSFQQKHEWHYASESPLAKRQLGKTVANACYKEAAGELYKRKQDEASYSASVFV